LLAEELLNSGMAVHASTERVFPRNDLDISAGLLLSDWL
jgi:hypothetical protein